MIWQPQTSLYPLDLPDNRAGRLSKSQRQLLWWLHGRWFAELVGLYQRKPKIAEEVDSLVGLFGKAREPGDGDSRARYFMVLGPRAIAINESDWNRLPQGWLRVYFVRGAMAVNAEILFDPADRRVDWPVLASTIRRIFELELLNTRAISSDPWVGLQDNEAGVRELVKRIAPGKRGEWDPSGVKPGFGTRVLRGIRSTAATRIEALLALADSEPA